MARTLNDILIDANAVLDLEAAAPTGDEQLTRANYANQAVWDASARVQFSEFKKEHLTTTSTLATIPLPSDFRELQEWPRVRNNGGWTQFEPIEVEQKYDRGDGEYYCYVMGDPASGYNMIFNNMIPDATLSIIYQRYPSGLLTLTDTCELPDPTYITRSVEKYVLYSRSDSRFPQAEAKAEQILANMAGREMKGTAGRGRDTKMKFKNPLS